MKKTDSLFIFLLLLLPAISLAQEKDLCLSCHQGLTRGIVKDWEASKHFQNGVDCSICHGDQHNSASNAHLAIMPNVETCEGCHTDQAGQFKEGKHALAWIAMNAMPKTASQPEEIMDGLKGCGGCHRIGLDGGKCDACHTRHKFSREEARNPLACATCHMGFDHPQYEMWSTSKHGVIFQMEKNFQMEPSGTDRVPRCQTCHMIEGTHRVMTAWGFMGLRLPEEDKKWEEWRLTILKGLGVLDPQGNPTSRMDVVKNGKVARLSSEEWKAERERIVKVCKGCHSNSYVKENFDRADAILKQADSLMAEAITVVEGLYQDKILKKQADYPMFPDLLKFYDVPTSIELKLYVMFLEHRMRTFQGAFHINPDYMHWYGWAEMKRDLWEINEEAKKMRESKK
ncbi:MAG: multiheme c-type cytochrome [candidate division Zixibacteria bacterium]|nr:multiheme c-type cytochrome [candidate division Zixibacteria bacterium]